MILLKQFQRFSSRREIRELLGGDWMKGVTPSTKYPFVLLFTNSAELYTDYFYPKGTYDYCMYTGIGRFGNQDSVESKMYHLNMEVLTHQKNKKKLLIFERYKEGYQFIGEYALTETHQNIQPR